MSEVPGPNGAASSDDVARVRLVLIRELETINTYEEMARAAQNPTVKNFFLHLASEEKEHVAEATEMLRMLDADQQAHFQKDRDVTHFEQRAHAAAPGSVAASRLAPTPAPKPTPKVELNGRHFPSDPKHILHAVPAPPSSYQFTVGSLKAPR